MKTRLKVNGIIIFLVVLASLIFPDKFLRNGPVSAPDAAAKIFGMAFIILGQIFRVSARGFKSESSREGRALVKEGPYALVRNPMYLGILLIGIGVVLMLFNWWLILAFLSIFVARYVSLIFKEEEKLEKAFPEEFFAYRGKVPRIIPSFAAVFKKDIAEYLPLKFIWLKREIGAMLAVVLAALALESWQVIRYNNLKTWLKGMTAAVLVIILFIFISAYLMRRTRTAQNYVSNKSKNTL